MLTVFYGADELRIQDAVSSVVESVKESDTTVVVERVEASVYEVGLLANLVEGMSLFGGSTIYILDNPSTVPEYEAELLELASALTGARDHFIVVERSLLTGPKKILSEHAAVITEYKLGVVKKFDAFALADALARKDKRALWLLLTEAKTNQLSAEEIIGVLWWQLKTLRLAALTKSAAEAGVKDYPYNKAKKALVNFKPGELETLSFSLLTFYHEGHGGLRDMDLALEEWVLKL